MSGRIDKDPDGGEFTALYKSTSESTSTRLKNTENYRILPVTAPAGYMWVDSTPKTLSGTEADLYTWPSGAINLGTFYVTTPQLQCSATTAYGIEDASQLTRVDTTTGVITKVGSPSTAVMANGLGISADGKTVMSFERAKDAQGYFSVAQLMKYDIGAGTWGLIGHQINASSKGIRDFASAAISPVTGRYYLGGFSDSSTRYHLWEFNPATNTSVFLGTADTSAGASGGTGGDMAFDPAGNILLARANSSNTTIFKITKSTLDAAAASPGGTLAIGVEATANTTSTHRFALQSNGKALLGNRVTLTSYDLPGWTNPTTVVSANYNIIDMASCGGTPPTLTFAEERERSSSGLHRSVRPVPLAERAVRRIRHHHGHHQRCSDRPGGSRRRHPRQHRGFR